MDLNQYIESVSKRFNSGISREHAYRSDLEQLVRNIVPNVELTNEPSMVTDCGNPDFVITRRDIPIGFIEAKDVNSDLKSKSHKEQFTRYKRALDNLIITDYLWFQFFQEGELVHEIRLAEIVDNKIIAKPDQFKHFENLIEDFCTFITQSIKSSKKLAEMMAGKAKLLQNVIEQAVTHDEKEEHLSTEDSWLISQYKSFKVMLIHDLEPKGFADIYAQTVAYGMFAARLHDETLNDFSRQEAAELIPKSNPFLRRLFSEIAGPNIDDRIKKIVDNLAEVFRATNVDALLKNFGKSTQTQDPIIHFYETFLAAYDPKLRKARGVWYTPEPVVNFIVRAVDNLLKTEFNLKDGLADTSKTTIKIDTQSKDGRTKSGVKQHEKEVHKVQILDPATGTGTFLAAVVKFIYEKKFKTMQGAWSQYVDEHLIPRLNGFELLMASYAMAHLKLDLLLKETGYKAQKNQRLNVYLTNSLEEYHPDTNDIFFSRWLSEESRAANNIKNDTPVMCVIGNPPYSGESSNKGEWIMRLMEDYKKEPGGTEKLKEQNSKFINDDYVKFLRYGQHFIEKNGNGILAFINPHGFLDNPTYRGMRWNLLKNYDTIYTIDLHGNKKKNETAPDGSPDVNVFDIEQGVSINIFVKTGNKKANQLGKVFHHDVFGKRDFKYDFLNENSLKTIAFKSFTPFENSFIFKDIDKKLYKSYNKWINPTELFITNVMGFQTHRDSFAVDFNKGKIRKRALDLINKELSNSEIYTKYGIKDNRDWKLSKARIEIQRDENWENKIIKCGYRPFDNRHCYFSYVMMDYPRKELIQNISNIDNLLLGIGRQGLAVGNIEWCLATVSDHPVDANIFRRGGVNLFPLYLYPENNGQQLFSGELERIPNINQEKINEIAEILDLTFINEKKKKENTFAPIDIFDYIYAVLHSPSYRKNYKEFLKTDFPRIPYPKDTKTFWQLVNLGGQIRQIHLMNSSDCENHITSYDIHGDNLVSRKMTKTSIGFEPNKDDTSAGKVWINDEQYFDGVPELAWNFYIGGYQPAQKWLKDRQGRNLNFDDILHYQKIIVALTETDRLMKEIDQIEIES